MIHLAEFLKGWLRLLMNRPNKSSTFFFLKGRERLFTEIFMKNIWGDNDSISGPGSSLNQTERIREILPLVIKELECRSILDIPSGDFYWMRFVDLEIPYVGGDIVTDIVKRNERQYANHNRKFIKIDLVKDSLPATDLLLCRDCFVHFSDQDVLNAIKNIKTSRIKFLFTTTFSSRNENVNIPTGSWRPINLQLPPFNFPSPVKLIDEKCPIEKYRDKCLGLWRIDEIPDPE
jgi:hypothetical protein